MAFPAAPHGSGGGAAGYINILRRVSAGPVGTAFIPAAAETTVFCVCLVHKQRGNPAATLPRIRSVTLSDDVVMIPTVTVTEGYQDRGHRYSVWTQIASGM